MDNNYVKIRRLIDSALSLIHGIKIDYNSQIGPKTSELIRIATEIVPLVSVDYPNIADILRVSVQSIVNKQVVTIPPTAQFPFLQNVHADLINAYSFGDIRTTIKILDFLYPSNAENTYKLFISHSTGDEIIINGFIEKILRLGCGFKRSDIFCTLDHTVIRTGDDFRDKIIDNMKKSDFVFCFISENYRKSEVCQNELGAAWSFDDKRVLPFKFPDVSFTEIGFLNVVKQAADITDKSKLDELYNELCDCYNIQADWRNFNEQKDGFVELVQNNIYKGSNT